MSAHRDESPTRDQLLAYAEWCRDQDMVADFDVMPMIELVSVELLHEENTVHTAAFSMDDFYRLCAEVSESLAYSPWNWE